MLAEAGVVDAGGTGLLLLLDAVLHVLDGRRRRATNRGSTRTGDRPRPHRGRRPIARRRLRYEVMYFLDAPTTTGSPASSDVVGGIGDSIVVVGGDGL